jgi:glutamyl-tRNA reductase
VDLKLAMKTFPVLLFLFCVIFMAACGGGAALSLSPKSVLVIGGTGRVGQKVTSKLVNEGHKVRLLVRDLQKVIYFMFQPTTNYYYCYDQ